MPHKITNQEAMKKTIVLQVWDNKPDVDPVLGEVSDLIIFMIIMMFILENVYCLVYTKVTKLFN